MEPKDQHPTRLELQQDGSDFKSDTKEDDSTHEFKKDGSPQPQDDQNTLPASRPMGMITSGNFLSISEDRTMSHTQKGNQSCTNYNL